MPPGEQKTRSQIPRLMKSYNKPTRTSFNKYQPFFVAPTHSSISHEPGKKPKDIKTNQRNSSLDKNHNTFGNSRDDWDYELDQFILNAEKTSINDAIEDYFTKKYDAQIVAYFTDIPNIKTLYSQTYGITTSHNTALAGYGYFSKKILFTKRPSAHPSFHPQTDLLLCPIDSPVAIVPLWDYRDVVVGVVEIVKTPDDADFTDEDEQFLNYFGYKFNAYSRFFMRPRAQEALLLDLLTLRENNINSSKICSQLANSFGCREAEIWQKVNGENEITKLGHNNTKYILKDSGIVGDSINELKIINVSRSSLYQKQSQLDKHDEAVLCVPIIDASNKVTICVVLRGALDRKVFTPEEENALASIAPFVGLSVSNAATFSSVNNEFERSKAEREGLAALLEVAEVVSGQLDIDRLTEVIMEKGRQLTKADRCALFLVNSNRDRLITSFQRGLKNAINIPIDKGIAGRTVVEGRAINIEDAYNEPAFDSSTDIDTGYRTRSILSVPIINNRGVVIGVTEMVNKVDLTPFTAWDLHLIKIFNVFCGISLENARLYRESVEMASQLRSFFDVSLSMADSKDIQKIVKNIIENARSVIGAQRASLFLVDATAGVLSTFIADGLPPQTLPLNAGIAGAAVKARETLMANDAYSDTRFNRTIDQQTGFRTESVLATPIISETNGVVGVVEMLNKPGGFTSKEVLLLESFATLAAVSLEKNRLKDIAELGSVEIELAQVVGESERQDTNGIPIKLQLAEEQKKVVSSLNFFSLDWKGLGHIKVLFYIFNKFKILQRFKIPNEMFFRFVYEIRATYNDVPYHNWNHAVDVTQYVAYQLTTAKLENVFTPLELFAILVSAVCHDANHDGFNNVYNLKAETPLGILFKNQSVMETHHCTVAIGVLTRDECNLLHSLSAADQKQMWNWITKLILATDMAHHFKMVKETTARLDEGKFDLKNTDDRTDAMELILKVADISNVSRPFKLANDWCDVLSEEFWRQGDNEKANGQELSSPLNDRNNKDKPKGQIGFYNFICIPLYQLVARIFPPLQVNLDSVKSNLEVWKSMTLPPPPEAK